MKNDWLASWSDILFYENINFNHGAEIISKNKWGISSFDQSSLERCNRTLKRIRVLFSFHGKSKYFIPILGESDSYLEIFPGISSLDSLPSDQLLFADATHVPLSEKFASTVKNQLDKQRGINAMYKKLQRSRISALNLPDTVDSTILDETLASLSSIQEMSWDDLINDDDNILLFGPHSSRFMSRFHPPNSSEESSNESIDQNPEEQIETGLNFFKFFCF